jgi:hypothetical protein
MSNAVAIGFLRRRQRRLRDQIDIFAAHRRKHAVVRMDARAQRRHLDAVPAPFVGADDAQQLAQRTDIRLGRLAMRLRAGFHHIRRAAQRNHMTGFERNEQHAQRAGTLRLRQTVLVEGVAHRRRRLARLAIDAPRQGLQQLPRILEIAAPQQAVPSLASRKALSPLSVSSATMTRFGGGEPASDCQRRLFSASPSVNTSRESVKVRGPDQSVVHIYMRDAPAMANSTWMRGERVATPEDADPPGGPRIRQCAYRIYTITHVTACTPQRLIAVAHAWVPVEARPRIRAAGLRSTDATYLRAITHQSIMNTGASVDPAYTQRFKGLCMTLKTYCESWI